MKLTYPLSSKGTKTSSYGYRTHPIKGTRTHHNGVDIGVPIIEKKEKKPIIGENGSLITADKTIKDDGVLA